MKLPHITIEVVEEESFAPGKVSGALIAGFGLHWAWVYLAMFNGATLFGHEDPAPGAAGFGISIGVFAAVLFCYGIFLEPMRRLFATPQARIRNRAVACGLAFAGTLLMAFIDMPGAAGALATAASGVCTGMGSAVLLMSYGVSFSVCDVATATTCTALSLAVSAVAFALVLLADQALHPLGAVLCLCIPFAEFACLAMCSRQLVDKLEFTMSTLSVHTAPFAVHVCLPCLVFGFLAGVLRSSSIAAVVAGGFDSMALPVMCAGASACVLVFAAMVMQRQSNNFMFRTLMPVVAVAIAALALNPGMDDGVAAFLLFGSYLLCEACVWVMCADISQRFRVSAFTVFGFGRGSCALGTLLAFALMTGRAMSWSPEWADMLAVCALVAVTLGMALLPKTAELRRTLKRGAHCPALGGDELYAAIDAGLPPAPASDSADERPEAPAHGTGATPGAEEAAAADAAAAPDDEADAESETVRMGRFKRKCAAVAETYLLSRKETEVLFLLAKGRNAAAICETLFISAGTANTHMRHIYRKLNVHSQQELIALVEGTEAN